ncbi:preprotein translocase subunit SecG [uncultured Coprobacter sp.]|uniref:preprotein translocase subunit SecG n=2 Tax=Barnesiellaceae TaxID=2005519 RepID=UPI002626EE5B|nr:preprotein translocase subunit SecG [uncultured Coprobacter sp.]
MYLFITILILIASIFLILIVLVQNSKGGGLASGFSSTNQIMGVRKTTDFVEKATWTLAGTVVILSIVASAFLPSANTGSHGSEIKDAIKKEIPATAQPGFETQQTTAPAAAQPDSAK